MKRSHKILSTMLIAGALFVGGAFVNSTMASQDNEKLATQTVQQYVSAFNTGDVETLAQTAKDTRFTDKSLLKYEYEQYVQRNKDRDTGLKFLSIEKADGDRFLANLELSSKEFKPTPFQLPVIKENGEWKIFVDGSVTVDTKH